MKVGCAWICHPSVQTLWQAPFGSRGQLALGPPPVFGGRKSGEAQALLRACVIRTHSQSIPPTWNRLATVGIRTGQNLIFSHEGHLVPLDKLFCHRTRTWMGASSNSASHTRPANLQVIGLATGMLTQFRRVGCEISTASGRNGSGGK